MSDLTKKIAENIKKYRTLNRLTQEKMAEKLNLDAQYYSQLERGERKFTIETIGLVCETFNLEIGNIIELQKQTAISDEEEKKVKKLIAVIDSRLPSLSLLQLQILQKYVDEILPLQNQVTQ